MKIFLNHSTVFTTSRSKIVSCKKIFVHLVWLYLIELRNHTQFDLNPSQNSLAFIITFTNRNSQLATKGMNQGFHILVLLSCTKFLEFLWIKQSMNVLETCRNIHDYKMTTNDLTYKWLQMTTNVIVIAHYSLCLPLS